MARLFVILFFILFADSVLAQKSTSQNEIDKRILKARIILHEEGGADKFVKIAEDILKDSRRILYAEGITKVCIGFVQAYNRMGEFSKGEKYLKMAENEAFLKTSGKDQAEVNYIYGQRYLREKLYDKGIESYKKMLVPEVIADNFLYAQANHGISVGFSGLKLIDSAYIYRKRSYNAFLKTKSPGANINFAVVATNLGIGFTKAKKYDSAKFYLDIALSASQVSKNPYAKAAAKIGMSNYYMKINKNDSSIIFMESALPLFKKMNFVYEVKDLYKDLSYSYRAINKDKMANQYLDLHNALADSLEGKNNLLVVVKSMSEKDKLLVDKEKRKMQYLIGIAVVCVFIAFMFGLYRFRIYKRTQKHIIEKKNDLLSSISEAKSQAEIDSLGYLLELAKKRDPAFLMKFNELYPSFQNRMLERFPDLNLNDLELCAYLRINLDTKEIARFANLSVRSVESKKYRLRKKFNISSSGDLTLFILNI
ncbi:hypothetical protein OQX61_21485 [Pedobacter sp. PLR]|uniref:helix-turn-helix transcriptional regulator n=1 Tax=Pedobacter sp. PLR TaxID=2994465 RepID=UPI002245EF24|nr:hypothetical protein [Pedobacter sp. PLR]MCX2453855.1 hypothetical protein [Pedobacter sp. PLR]